MTMLTHPTGLQNGQSVIYIGSSEPACIRPQHGRRLIVRSVVRGGRDSLDTHHVINGNEYVWVVDGLDEFLVARKDLEAA